MKRIVIALIIGTCAGILDVVPMIIQHLNWYANFSAFIFWIALGLVIPFVNWKIPAWLKGFIIAELFAIPIIIITLRDGSDSILPISLTTSVIGTLVGIAGKKFITPS